ncbi:hypothetical protein [Natrononativus amylolyticus]|uniref:hypothetical protein n=1 Tax=Natrononativus amylolyticus TaxID=2963434 RepID=UPI0020CC829A|nr:hypothetical protein [Natrononativus amylolyticus]
MNYGLDITSDGVRLARTVADGADLEVSRAPAVACPLESIAEVPPVALGERCSIERDGTTYVLGEDAERVADATGAALEPLFVDGVPAGEHVEPALSALVGGLLADAGALEGAIGGRLCYTTPGRIVDGTESTIRGDRREGGALPGDFASAAGLEPAPITAGFAVVYDQLAADKHTGLGICIGEQLTSVSLSYYGVPALAFSLPKGREWLIAAAADDTGSDPVAVAAALEAFTLDPDAATGEIESALAGAFDALAVELATAIADRADESDLQSGLAVPVAVAGSGAVEGVEYLLGGRFDGSPLPISIRGVRLAEEPAECAARGALAAATDGIDGLEAVTWSAPEAAPTAGETLTFSEPSADDPTASDGSAIADDAIDQLFDRLANRDAEIEAVAAEVETLSEALESVDKRAATAVDALGDDLEGVSAAVADLETSLEATRDDLTATGDALAELRDTHERLAEESATAAECARLDAALADLEDRLDAAVTRVDRVSDRLEEHSTEAETRVAELAGHVESLSADVESLSAETDDGIAHLTATFSETESALEGRVDSAVADLESSLSTLETAIGDVDDRLDTTRSELEREIDDRLETEPVDPERVDRLESRVADLTEIGPRCGTLEERLEALEVGADRDASRARDDLVDLRADLEAVRAESKVSTGVAVPMLAGGGAAGIVAGGVTAASVGDPVGLAGVLLGAVLVGVAGWLTRS